MAITLPRIPVKSLLQLLCGLALVTFLLWQALRGEAVTRLIDQPKDPVALAVAMGLVLLSTGLSFVRWKLIAHAAELKMSLGEAMRLGAIGFASNFIALGNVGGDVVKAALLARRRPGVRTIAVTTVVVDRLMGLFALLVYASAAILITGSASSSTELPDALRMLCRSTLVVTALAIACFSLVIVPGRPVRKIASAFSKTPFLGTMAKHAAAMADLYQRGWRWLVAALAVGLVTDGLFISSFYAVSQALPLAAPSYAEHGLLTPLAMIAGALPISPSGLGTMEAAVEMLYRALGTTENVLPGNGTLVSLGHRLVMLLVGALAVGYYLIAGHAERLATKEIEKQPPFNEPGQEPVLVGETES